MTVNKECTYCGKGFTFSGKPSLCARRKVCSAACGRAIGTDLARQKSKLPYDFDVLYDLYWNQGLSTNEIGNRYQMASSDRYKSGANVNRRMRALGVPTRKKGSHPLRAICVIEGCRAPIYKVLHKQNGYYGRRCLQHWVAHRHALGSNYWHRILKYRKSGGGDLDALVQKVVPKALPHEVRDECCQEITLDLLLGKIRPGDLSRVALSYIKRFFKEYQDKFGALSLDAPMGEDGVTLGELLDDRGKIGRAA